MTTFELWNVVSGNRIGGFSEMEEVVEVVRQIAELQGVEATKNLFVEVWTTFDALDPVLVVRGFELISASYKSITDL